MTRQPPNKVDALCLEALTRHGSARAAFLDEACGDDTELRREVESLLAGEHSGAFLEAPIWNAAATRFRPGVLVGPYQIESLIGAGGMGEVYKARDSRLGRTVAIKVLPAGLAWSAERRRRFEHEAHAAAALNHPHVCTIYDVGMHAPADNAPPQEYLVMEYLQGETLAERLRKGALPVDEALHLADQIADGLAAAHRHGIVHRDLKPANVILTKETPAVGNVAKGPLPPVQQIPSGKAVSAKILDFGLAKEVEESGREGRAERVTETTRPGAILGTLGYQSPEQARGETIDFRTDLFSFGVTFYEMLTGRQPFRGHSDADTIGAVLYLQPPAPSQQNGQVPTACDAIVAKAIEKDRELRYQSASEIRVDLARAQRELAEASSAAVPPRPVGGKRRSVARLASAAIVVAGLATALVAWLRTAGDVVPAVTTREVSWGSGTESEPAIAPDGRTIAYSAEDEGGTDIYLADLDGRSARRWTTNPGVDRHPAWSADGMTIYFESDRNGKPGIYEAPTLNSEAAVLLFPRGREPTISPDGTRLAFTLRRPPEADRIAVGAIRGSPVPRVISTAGLSDHGSPVWSPDGSQICYWAWDGLWIVPSNGGTARQLTRGPADLHPAWSPSGFIYFSSTRGGVWQIWRVSEAGTGLATVTAGLGAEQSPSVSRDGRMLAFSSVMEHWHVAVRDLASGVEREIRAGDLQLHPSYSHDGRLLFMGARAAGHQAMWVQPLTSGRPEGAPAPLLLRFPDPRPAILSQPAPSPDGQWIAFLGITGESRDVWVAPTGGGDAVNLTSHPARDDQPAWSPDGTRIAFASERGDEPRIWVHAVRQGRPLGAATRLTSGTRPEYAPVFSPDGSQVAFVIVGADGQAEVAVVDAVGQPVPTIITSGADAWYGRWASREQLLVNGGWRGRDRQAPRSLRLVNVRTKSVVDSGVPIPLPADRHAAAFDVAPDGKSVALVRGQDQGRIGILQTKGGRF